MTKDNIKRICLWSGPRNISTAFMYAFAQREDTLVVDEPLYAHYLSQTAAKEYHPGAEEVLNSMENDGKKVIEFMMGIYDKPIVFFKQMTHHLLDLDRSFMKSCMHIILTRDPRDMLPSFAKEIENPSMKDLGYSDHIELITYLNKINLNPIVIDAKKLLENPKNILNQLCELLHIPFDENMLKWKRGGRPEDGVWAKYWYKNIHNSSGFKKPKEYRDPLPNKLQPILMACTPYYQQLTQLSIELTHELRK